MAKRRKRRKNNNLFYALCAAVIVIGLTVSIVAVVASQGFNSGGGESSSEGQPVEAPVGSAESEESQIVSQEQSSSSEPQEEENPAISNNRLANGDYIEYTAEGAAELDQWYLKLTNKWVPAGADFIPENLVRINNEGYMFDSRAYGAYKDMTAAAWEDGVTIYAISAYRPYTRQETLYKQRIKRFMDQGLSEEEATEKAGTIVAVPGTSEHQIGLAIDFNSVEQEFENTKAGKWLAENCWDYGFVLRYPTDKTELTGIIYEPWHFRFVGVKHAKKMKELDMCLEEYVEYLKTEG